MMHVFWHTGGVDISWEQALAWRMRRHYLIERGSPDDLVAVVDRLRGLHAQVMSSVDLALWARIDRLEQDAVADALWRQLTLVRMWAMRAALHVLPADDLGAWIAGFGHLETRRLAIESKPLRRCIRARPR
jgi:Winged helix DNA-binding domain